MLLNLLSTGGIARLTEAISEFVMRLAGLHAAKTEYAPAYVMAAILIAAMLLREELQKAAQKPATSARRRHMGRGRPVAHCNELVDA